MKKITLLLAAAIFASTTTAMAQIPLSEISLGGVTPNTDRAYVQEIYGEGNASPVQYDYRQGYYSASLKYGDSVEIWSSSPTADGEQMVSFMIVRANNGFATPKGIHVGSTLKEVLTAYGRPDGRTVNIKPDKKPKTLNYRAYNSGANISFMTKNDIVTEIRMGFNL